MMQKVCWCVPKACAQGAWPHLQPYCYATGRWNSKVAFHALNESSWHWIYQSFFS